MLGQEKIEIHFPDGFARICQLEPGRQRPVDPDKPALLVFKIDMVDDVIHQSSDQEALLLQRLVAFQQLAVEPAVPFVNPPQNHDHSNAGKCQKAGPSPGPSHFKPNEACQAGAEHNTQQKPIPPGRPIRPSHGRPPPSRKCPSRAASIPTRQTSSSKSFFPTKLCTFPNSSSNNVSAGKRTRFRTAAKSRSSPNSSPSDPSTS